MGRFCHFHHKCLAIVDCGQQQHSRKHKSTLHSTAIPLIMITMEERCLPIRLAIPCVGANADAACPEINYTVMIIEVPPTCT